MRSIEDIVNDLDKFPEGSAAYREVLKELDAYWKREWKKVPVGVVLK